MIEPDWHEQCRARIGRTETRFDELSPYAANGMLATLDDAPDLSVGDPLPLLFHWLYFNEPVRSRHLKSDGHEVLGDFLPPVEYPHRMWAGSSVEFHATLRLGKQTTRISTIVSIEFKSGSSGALCFVNVEHQYLQRDILCLTDLQTIVYRESSGNKSWHANSIDEMPLETANTQRLNSIALFRYSALTFNSHRIHYDLDYCRNVETYPDLVVHGPLMATLIMRHMLEQQQGQLPARFGFRGISPMFAGEGFHIESETVADNTTAELLKLDGKMVMSASAVWP